VQNGHIFLKQSFLPTHWVILTDYFAPNHSSVVEMHVFHQIVCIFTCSKQKIHLTPETLFTQKQMNLPKQSLLTTSSVALTPFLVRNHDSKTET